MLGTGRCELMPCASLCASFCEPLNNGEASNPIQQHAQVCSCRCMCRTTPYRESVSSWPAPLPRQNARGVGKRFGLCAAWKCIRPTAEDFQIMSLAKPEVSSLAAQVLPTSCRRMFRVVGRGKIELTLLGSLRVCHERHVLVSRGLHSMS